MHKASTPQPVFGVSDIVRHQIFACSKFRHDTFQNAKKNTKGADQYADAQTGLHLCCSQTTEDRFFASRPNCKEGKCTHINNTSEEVIEQCFLLKKNHSFGGITISAGNTVSSLNCFYINF